MADLDPVGLQSLSITGGTPRGRHIATSERLLLFDIPFEAPAETSWFAGVNLSRVSGARLQVSGSDPAWVRSTFNELKSEMQKGVPSWWRLRHGYMWFAYAALAVGASALALEPTLSGRLWLWVLASVGVAILLGSILLVSARRLLPGFELVHEGQSGKSVAVLTFLAALLAQIPVGILVNKLTQ